MEIEIPTRSAFSIILGLAFGVFVSSFIFIQPLVAVLVIIVGLAIWLVEKNPLTIFIFLLIISFGLGSLRYSIKDFHELKEPALTGVLVTSPETKENSKKFVLESDNGEKVLVYAPLFSEIDYGDRVEVSGKLNRAEKYLSRDDIYWALNFGGVKVLEKNRGHPVKAALFRLKDNFVEQIKKILPEPEAGLLAGLLVSGKESLPKNILDQFTRAGIIHLVVLSGFNISLIAEFIKRVLRSRAAALVSVALFVIMTGAEASIVRAAIMAGIAVWAKAVGREYHASRALVLAATLMILINPKILVFDRSFQLSFLATLGLIHFMSPIQKRLGWLTDKIKIRETVSQTLATQAAVFPLLIFTTGTISPMFLPANVLTLLIVPYTMLAGFLATLLSYAHTILALPFTYLSHLLLSWVLFVAQLFGNIS